MRRALLALVLACAAVCRARAEHCASLRQRFNMMPERVISVLGREHELQLVWGGRAPARAAAALFAAVLRHGLRYRNVSLLEKPNDLCQIATQWPYNENTTNCCILAVSAAWTPAQAKSCTALSCPVTQDIRRCTVTGPRLTALGPGVVPLALRLLVYIPPHVATDDACRLYTHWSFYRDKTIIKRCNFITDSEYSTHFSSVERSGSSTTDTYKGFAAVLTPSEYITIAQRLAVRAAAVDLQLTPVPLGNDTKPRHDLVRLLNSNNSFLFLDYDVWAGAAGVHHVNMPPCTLNETCSSAFDSTAELLVADGFTLGQFAQRVLDAAQRFDPKQMELREILKRETNMNIEEAACSWAADNVDRFELWFDKSYSRYKMIVLLCEDDPDHERYKHIAETAAHELNKNIRFSFNVSFVPVNCINSHGPPKQIHNERNKYKWQQVAGMVAPNTGTSAIGFEANQMEVAVMIYGPSAAPDENLSPAACSVAGRATDQAAAFRRFLSERRWERVAILSERDEYAKEFSNALLENDTLVTCKESVSAAAPSEIERTLQTLQAAGARVFVLNTGAVTAGAVLCAASRLGMAAPATYAWVAREAAARSCAVCYSTVSFVRHGDDNISSSEGGANLTKALGAPPWPRLGAPIVDSLALLIRGMDALLRRHPKLMNDVHARGSMRELATVLREIDVPGVTQELSCRRGALHEPRVFVDHWSGAERLPLAVWRVAADGVRVELEHATPPAGATPHDGTRLCYTTRSGHPFAPHCHDVAWAALVVTLALATPALLAARRIRLARLERRDGELAARFGAQRERVTAAFTALADHEIDRDALDLREEIGAGYFGRVRLGTLRWPGKPPLEVAVKELREDTSPTDIDEFIREARLLASLRHAHVVRFVGVCDVSACPLVLMEHALFGDLLCYVRSRRHLAERVRAGIEAGPEAAHVSAEALTRLGREAAEAVAYLARLQLVHRDLRAENCLVDAHRTLKLSDFGMTREVGHSTGEYACVRRGVFPVRWMAPESVSRGVFSAASDVWSLGVLLLELATLGARPYGDRPSMAVVEHVRAGGCPALPHDASSPTCGLVLACWRAAAEERPTAAEVAAFLASRPRALRPALLSPHSQPDDHAAASLSNTAYVTTL